MHKIVAVTLLYFAVTFSIHSSIPTKADKMKGLLNLCAKSLLQADSLIDLQKRATEDAAAKEDEKRYKASTQLLKKNLFPSFQNVISLFKFQLRENPLGQGKSLTEYAFDLALHFLESDSNPHPLSPQISETFRKLFDEQQFKHDDNDLNLGFESTLDSSHEILRFIISSSHSQNAFFIRIELRNEDSRAILATDNQSIASESINILVQKDSLGIWQGMLSHSFDSKKQNKPHFCLDQRPLEANPALKSISHPETLETRNEEEKLAALNFILSLKREQGKSPFPSVIFLPQRPKDLGKLERYKSFLKSFGAFSHQIKFTSHHDLNSFLKRILTRDLGSTQNTSSNQSTSLMNLVEDGLPVLIVFHPEQFSFITPRTLTNGVPSDHKVAEALAATLHPFSEHGKITMDIHENAHPTFQHSEKEGTSEDQNETPKNPDSISEKPLEEPRRTTEISPEAKLEKALLELEVEKDKVAELEEKLEEEKKSSQLKAQEIALTLAVDEITNMQLRIQELESKLRQSRSAELNLLTRVKQLEESGDLNPAQLKKLRSLEAQGMKTVANAVQFADVLHPGSFELTKQASEQLAKLSVSDAKDQEFAHEIYSSLVSLWHILWAPDAPLIYEQKIKLFKELSGLEIAFDESHTTKEKLRAQNERRFIHDNKVFFAWPHIKLSDSRRIYFALDTENKKVLIFSWPHHLWTQIGN